MGPGPVGTAPPGYPSAYEADVVLADGATATVRPIIPADAPRLRDFHGRQSPQSIYYRYFSPRPRLSDQDLEHLTTVDYVDRMALVALRGEELLGVARYDRWRHRSEAEVAFFVDDANRGRGLATLLLEHLAVRAREVGLSGFTASVLAENRRMIGVFTQAGFEVATSFADGVIDVHLGLSPTPAAETAIEGRARAAASQAVRRLLAPTSVAVIGAGRRPGTIGHDVFANLRRGKFQGHVWPVNVNAREVDGVPAVASVLDVEGEVDLAVIAVPAHDVAAVVDECGRKGVHGVVILSAGFAEQGTEGVALEDQVLRTARSWGVRVVGPNCLGVINTDPAVRLHATFVPVVPSRGRMSLLSESGMVGAAIIGRARELGLGVSSFVALGNRADVSANDLLQYWEGDDGTDVVALYIESFGNVRHFSRLVRRLGRHKPVVAVKTGMYEASPAGDLDDRSEGALLRQTGVIHVPTLTALIDTARLLCSQPLPAGPRVAVVGNAGGSLTIAADAARRAGLELAELSDASVQQLMPFATGPLRTTAPMAGTNPLSLGLTAGGAEFEEVVRVLAADPGVDGLLAVYAPSLGGSPAEVRAALDAGRAAAPEVPIAACFYVARDADLGPEVSGRVPVYEAVDAAAAALGRVAEHARWRALPVGEVEELADEQASTARDVVVGELRLGCRELGDDATDSLLARVGLSRVGSVRVGSLTEAEVAAETLGYPVVLKAASRPPTAKTVAEGMAVDVADGHDLATTWSRLHEHLGEGMLPVTVQPMLAPGVDVAVEVTDTDHAGPVVSLRPGGAAGALEPPDQVRVLPLGHLEVERFVDECRVASRLDPADRAALGALVSRIGALVEAVPEIAGLRANPVVVRAGEAVLTDLAIEVTPRDRTPVPPIRRV